MKKLTQEDRCGCRAFPLLPNKKPKGGSKTKHWKSVKRKQKSHEQT